MGSDGRDKGTVQPVFSGMFGTVNWGENMHLQYKKKLQKDSFVPFIRIHEFDDQC